MEEEKVLVIKISLKSGVGGFVKFKQEVGTIGTKPISLNSYEKTAVRDCLEDFIESDLKEI